MDASRLVEAWSCITAAMGRLLSKGPADRRIMVAVILSHRHGVISHVEINANVSAITAHQGLLIATQVLAARPEPLELAQADEFTPTLCTQPGLAVNLTMRDPAEPGGPLDEEVDDAV